MRIAMLAAVFALTAAIAPARAEDAYAGRTPEPVIPKGQGEHCIRSNAFMRRYHMTMLLHQRDVTMHEGGAPGEFSITRCVQCHVVKGADGKAVTYADPRHFCRACHDYEAVSIDCFECHASRPPTEDKAETAADADHDLAALAAYLGERRP